MSVELVTLALLMAAVTYPSRSIPLLLSRTDRLPHLVDEYLRLIGPGVLAALAALSVLVVVDTDGSARLEAGIELVAVLVCIGVVVRRRSLLPGLLLAVAIVAVARWLGLG
jgi:branched-subunit amino acid transport protein